MINGQLIPSPAIFPSACVGCGSQKGPTFDTLIERPGIGRIYVCRLCATSIARAFGLVEGERMEELMEAADGIEEAERQVEIRNEKLTELGEEIVAADARLAGREAELETERGKVALLLSLGDTIADTTEQLQDVLGQVRGQVVEREPVLASMTLPVTATQPEGSGINLPWQKTDDDPED